MSGFATGWLALREPYDHAARSAALDRHFAGTLRDTTGGGAVALVDLGGGIGSTVRALAPLIGGRQDWTVVDHDPGLLDALPSAMADWATARGLAAVTGARKVSITGEDLALSVTGRSADLAAGPLPDLLADAVGVTASALLDLVSAAWLEQLAAALDGRPALFALSYDGRLAFDPPDPLDNDVRDLFDRHQRRDKGLGPALGPDSANVAERILTGRGHGVSRAESPWRLGDGDSTLSGELIEGFAAAASEQAPDRAAELAAWRMRRLAAVESGGVRLTVGHVDLLALPAR